jgi:exonuclease III
VRIATWNVNSLKARLERVIGWLDRARPDVLLVQETKLADDEAPRDAFRHAGYELAHHGTHVSPPEREAFFALCRWGREDGYRRLQAEPGRYTWWDYRAGSFHNNFGMRIDHLLATRAVADRIVWSEIDREARKGKPTPSDHAPLVMDLDRPGHPFDAGWAGAERRIAARREGADGIRRGVRGRRVAGAGRSRFRPDRGNAR